MTMKPKINFDETELGEIKTRGKSITQNWKIKNIDKDAFSVKYNLHRLIKNLANLEKIVISNSR